MKSTAMHNLSFSIFVAFASRLLVSLAVCTIVIPWNVFHLHICTYIAHKKISGIQHTLFKDKNIILCSRLAWVRFNAGADITWNRYLLLQYSSEMVCDDKHNDNTKKTKRLWSKVDIYIVSQQNFHWHFYVIVDSNNSKTILFDELSL